jgi:uncharacterized protein
MEKGVFCLYNQENLKKIIDIFINKISTEIEIDALYLFGSFAKGTADRYSDIDIAIFSRNFEGSRFIDKKKLNKHILSTSIDLEVHPFNTNDFNNNNPFVQEIMKTGIRII